MYKAVELFTPAASVTIQAYPNPGSLVLGGIVGLLSVTNRLLSYQKLTMQMLSKMGKKARVLLEYDKDIYKDEMSVQSALINVYRDIIIFCQKAFQFLTKNGQPRARVKGLKLIMFRDYESQLGKEVQDFENHLDDLETKATLCDKRRLKELHDNRMAHHSQIRQETREEAQRQNDFLLELWQKDQNLRERSYSRSSS